MEQEGRGMTNGGNTDFCISSDEAWKIVAPIIFERIKDDKDEKMMEVYLLVYFALKNYGRK